MQTKKPCEQRTCNDQTQNTTKEMKEKILLPWIWFFISMKWIVFVFLNLKAKVKQQLYHNNPLQQLNALVESKALSYAADMSSC